MSKVLSTQEICILNAYDEDTFIRYGTAGEDIVKPLQEITTKQILESHETLRATAEALLNSLRTVRKCIEDDPYKNEPRVTALSASIRAVCYEAERQLGFTERSK